AATAPAVAVASRLVRTRWKKIRRRGDRLEPGTPPAEYHALRIRCKRLRYALEFFLELYGPPAKKLVRRLVKIQDHLGLHQDSTVAMEELQRLVARKGRKLPPQTLFVLGRIVEHHARRAADLRARFPKVWSDLRDRKRIWKRLNQAMIEANEEHLRILTRGPGKDR
ncbi:MAG: CHAD domain-containing protein, partial [Candidatus Eisenbacteria bacterium]|nr:CHAD domain-containing protein [Candidatus Latescibacterota bacterium]MBD3302134.1 CHAD domain-containing protein [Candidatus Eisenbacteria bacterium]